MLENVKILHIISNYCVKYVKYVFKNYKNDSPIQTEESLCTVYL